MMAITKEIKLAIIISLICVLYKIYTALTFQIPRCTIPAVIYNDDVFNIPYAYRKMIRLLQNTNQEQLLENPINYTSNLSQSENYFKKIREDWKIILFDNIWFFMDWSDRFLYANQLKEARCPSWKCMFTYDKSYLEDADAVIFSPRLNSRAARTKRYNKDQIWIYADVEAAPGIKVNALFFNWTFNYHQTSDVVAFNGFFVSLNESAPLPIRANIIRSDEQTFSKYTEALKHNLTIEETEKAPFIYYSRKKKYVAWVASHCPTKSKREEYVSELEKYIPVGKYGSCGTEKCLPKSVYQADCWIHTFAPNYLFFLSMENALCRDYISEKLYKPLVYGLVPIVYGGSSGLEYDDYLPPNSYINARFYQPKELAELIKRIAKDPLEYNKYHLWRNYWKVVILGNFCELCAKLHLPITEKYYTRANAINQDRKKHGRCIKAKRNMFKNGFYYKKVYVPMEKRNVNLH